MPTYKPVCKYDTAGQGYDESAYDIGRLSDSISFGMVDTKATSGDLTLAENLSMTDGVRYVLSLTEAFSIVDSAVKTGVKNLSESLGIVDSKTTSGSLLKAEGLSMVDTKLFRIFFAEAFSIIDSDRKIGSKLMMIRKIAVRFLAGNYQSNIELED